MLTFYILAGALTLIACLSILLPFIRPLPGTARTGRDIDVYREQLAEIDADERRGLIGTREAAEARAELGRRILRAAGQEPQQAQSVAASRWIILAAMAAIPLASIAIYGSVGSPGMPDQPLLARLQADPAGSSIDELVARTERHLAANPADGRGWSVIAPVYLRLGRHADAVSAYRKALEHMETTPLLLAGLGEALAAAHEGMVTGEARALFERALALDPSHEKSRFFLGLALAQEGAFGAARTQWRELIDAAAPESPWRHVSQQALAEAEAMEAGEGAAEDPSAVDPDAAAGMTPDERMEMIEGMVASLAARLEDEPQDPTGWERLIRSYMVLGRRNDAEAALGRARAALAGDAEATGRLESLAGELDLADG